MNGSDDQNVEAELEQVRSACDRAESQVSSLRFSYSDPEPHFDRSRVKGLVAELIEVRDERFTNAIEVCAGGKLYQVVVDTDETGSALLKKGRLQRRVTIIPLNRIRHHTLPPAKVLQAQRLAPQGSVSLALTLVGYSESVQEAIEYVFGTTLVCETLDVARKVAFHPGVRARTVTLDGDIVDPSGVLEGGARSRSVPVLQLLAEANQLRDRRVALEQEAAQLRASFERLRGKRQTGAGAAQHGGAGEKCGRRIDATGEREGGENEGDRGAAKPAGGSGGRRKARRSAFARSGGEGAGNESGGRE